MRLTYELRADSSPEADQEVWVKWLEGRNQPTPQFHLSCGN